AGHEEKESYITLDDIDLTRLLTPPLMKRIWPHNRYYNVFSDILDVHHFKHYQPTFISFTNTSIEITDQIIRWSKDNPQNLYFYLLANIHQYIDIRFHPKKKSGLFSILTTFKTHRFNET